MVSLVTTDARPVIPGEAGGADEQLPGVLHQHRHLSAEVVLGEEITTFEAIRRRPAAYGFMLPSDLPLGSDALVAGSGRPSLLSF